MLRAVVSLDSADVTVCGERAELDLARAAADELREQVRRLVNQLRRSRHPDLVQAELDEAESELDEVERRVIQLEQSSPGDQTRSLSAILSDGDADEKRAVISAYLDRVIVRRGAGALSVRSLLLLRGEERRFEPLPGPGRKLPLASWPAFPARRTDALQLAG